MENIIKQFLDTDIDHGWGYGEGEGSDSGWGYGSNSCGSSGGTGEDYSEDDGCGTRYGHGTCFSEGCGDSFGKGFGDGYVIKSYDGHEVYIIDNFQAIIYAVHGNIARGAIIKGDLTLTDCYIAKYENHFAHGRTVAQAMTDAQSKAYRNKPIEARIDYVIQSYPDVDRPIEHSVLFSLHNFLTGSCLFGRQEFAKSHDIDPEHGSMTMREFILLTKDAYGEDNIRQLADAYKIKL